MKPKALKEIKSVRFAPDSLARLDRAVVRSEGRITESQIIQEAVRWYLDEMDRRGGFFVDFKGAGESAPNTLTPTDFAALRVSVAKAHHAATRNRKAKA